MKDCSYHTCIFHTDRQSVSQSNLYSSTVALSGLQKIVIYINEFKNFFKSMLHLSFIDLERGGFGEILHEVMIFPEGNIITEGNISPNSPSGGSINDILHRKLKASKLRIKNLTHTFVNTMFYFRINASIVAFLSNHISFGILMTKPQVLGLKKPQVLGLKLKYSSLVNTIYVLSAILLSCVLSRVVYANNVPPHVPRGTWGGTLSKGTQAR